MVRAYRRHLNLLRMAAMKPIDFRVSAPRWLLVACISALLFLLGVTSEYAREQRRDNDKLREEAMKRFQEQYSADIQERLGRVELRTKIHSEEMAEFRSSMKEFSRTVSDHGLAVRELAYQVRQLGNKVALANRGQ